MTRRRHFIRHQQGVATVEFALMLPVLLLFFYGVLELTRYILIAQKAEKIAFTVADSVAQDKTVTVAELSHILSATNYIMQPYTFSTKGVVIISSLYRADGAAGATVNWQYKGGGSLVENSLIGALGATPTMPGGFTFDNKENVISAEVYYQFSPVWTTRFFGTTVIYRAAFYKPRLGLLTTTPS